MPKITLDMSAFKALASDTRLDILRALDGKNMSLNDISRATKLNKATLHEHLTKLYEAGLVKKNEREGHKWVYYRLTWKGEGLLHPENTKIVVMFSVTFISLFIAVILLVNFAQPITVGRAETIGDTTYIYEAENIGTPLLEKSYNYNLIGTINAANQTAIDVTSELQSKGNVRNSIGSAYGNADIKWLTPSNAHVAASQNLYTTYFSGQSLDMTYYNDYSKISKIKLNVPSNETQYLVNFGLINKSFVKLIFMIDLSNLRLPFYNTVKGMNSTRYESTGDNEMNWDGVFLSYSPSPVVPEMIATVQDTTFLYGAIICITFFGVLFTLSSWKFYKNRKPKL